MQDNTKDAFSQLPTEGTSDPFIDSDGIAWTWDWKTCRWYKQAGMNGTGPAQRRTTKGTWKARKNPATLFSLVTATRKPRPIAIEPFIRQGDCTFLVGERGQGKSTLCADFLRAFAHAALADTPEVRDLEVGAGAFRFVPEFFLNKSACILDGENEPGDWREFLTQTLAAYGQTPHDPVMREFFDGYLYHLDSQEWPLCPMSFPHDHEDARAALVAELRRRECGLLVIDPLHAIYGRKGIEKPDWVREGLEPLRHDLRAFGCNLLVLAHPSRYYPDKPAQNLFLPLGTGAQEGVADCMIGIWRPPKHRKERLIKLELIKRRAAKWNLERTAALLHGSEADGGYTSCKSEWKTEDPRPKAPTVLLSIAERRLLLSCPPAEDFAYQDLEGERAFASKTVRNIFFRNELVSQTGGTGKKGDPMIWRLTEKGRAIQRRYQEEAETWGPRASDNEQNTN